LKTGQEGDVRSHVHRSLLGLVLAVAVAAVAVAAVAVAPAGGQAPTGGEAVSYELTGTIDPATAGWVSEALEDAEERGAALVIFRLDTPGGLDASMRDIVQAILRAPMPVVVHVAPDGARAASAGLFVTLAADVAAMAPQTNIGSATPVSVLGGDDEEDDVMGRKIREDAAAYVRALAEGHGRNADLAERMVRDAENVTAGQALDDGLIDVVATTGQELLAELDGFEVQGPKAGELETADLVLVQEETPWYVGVRQALVNPTVAFLLLMGGLLLIALEVFSPGLVGPGLFGAVALLLGLYGTAQIPLGIAGVVLLVVAVALIVAELAAPSGGLFGGAGVVALVAAGLLLYDTDSDAYAVSVPIAVAVGAALGSFTLFAASKALSARRAPPRGGIQDLVGLPATVKVPLDPEGQVYVEGALWRARATGFPSAPGPGERVRVRAVEDLTLEVEPAPPDPDPAPDPKEPQP
jgi:membrane-bound serine protease (ClpP class)